jgi:hypothetical protein
MNPQFDHFLTFVNTANIDEYIEQYRALGFVVSNETRPYKPGLRNRFVTLGCEYLELVWVENEEDFARGGTEEFARMFTDLPTLRQASRPFSVGFISYDVEALHQEWTLRGYNVSPVWSFAPPGMPPILSFQEIPDHILPGASCFAITYHNTSSSQARSVQRAANTTYAVEGVTFVSTGPEEAAGRWQMLLNPEIAVTAKQNIYAVMVPPHIAWWMSPQVFQERYDIALKTPHHRYGHLAAIHLLAENLDVATGMFGQRLKKRVDNARQEEFLVISPTSADGVTFIFREYPIERWRSERSSMTGEMIVVP